MLVILSTTIRVKNKHNDNIIVMIFVGKLYNLISGIFVVLLESPCECGIEPPGSISHGVSRFSSSSPKLKVNINFTSRLHRRPNR